MIGSLGQPFAGINNKQNSSPGGANLSDDCNKPVTALPSAEVSVSMYSTSLPEPPHMSGFVGNSIIIKP